VCSNIILSHYANTCTILSHLLVGVITTRSVGRSQSKRKYDNSTIMQNSGMTQHSVAIRK